MSRNYGIPYMGSKSSILTKLCSIFPDADNFYDVFGGGFSVSHFMIRNRADDYKNFYFNEIREGVCELISEAIDGKYNYDIYKPEFINREMFLERKDTDAMVKIIWSFGNNGKNYLFGKDIEKQKESLHNAVIFNVFDEQAKEFLGMDGFSPGYSVYDKRIFVRQKKSLQQLQQLQQLERLQQLHFSSKDYREISFRSNSVIYCDPPYIGTAGYDECFDHKDFYKWAASQSNPVFISEYTQPEDDRFFLLMTIRKRSKMAAKMGNNIKIEKLFGNKAAFDAVNNRTVLSGNDV